MAPFSPLPFGFQPRSPKPQHHRPFRHIFGQTIPRSSLSISAPMPIVCGPEPKGWMACLAVCCFLVVVWLAALPTPTTPMDISFLGEEYGDLGDATGLGLWWSQQSSKGAVQDTRGAAYGPEDGPHYTRIYIPVVTDLVKRAEATLTTPVTPKNGANSSGPTPMPPVGKDRLAPSPSPTPSSHSTTFDAPPQAEKPSAEKTGGGDWDIAEWSSSPEAAEKAMIAKIVRSSKLGGRDMRRSRARRNTRR